MPFDPPPRLDMPPIAATAIKAAINPYSIAVAPRLSERSLRPFVRIASTATLLLVLVHNPDLSENELTFDGRNEVNPPLAGFVVPNR